jgi:hypothetical protein
MIIMLRLVEYIVHHPDNGGFNEAVSPLVGRQTQTGTMLALSSVIPS